MDCAKMGHMIGTRRRQLGWTQRQLAERLGVTDKAVSKWERGLSCPDTALVLPLARLLGLTPDQLLEGAESAPLAACRETVKEEIRPARPRRPLRTAGAALLLSLPAALTTGVLAALFSQAEALWQGCNLYMLLAAPLALALLGADWARHRAGR